jgi:hypothetical protein
MEAIPDNIVEQVKTIYSWAPVFLQAVVTGKDIYDKRYVEALYDGAMACVYGIDAIVLRIVTPASLGLAIAGVPITVGGGLVNIGYQQFKGVPNGAGADPDKYRNGLRWLTLACSVVVQGIVIAGVVQRGREEDAEKRKKQS